MRARIEAIEYYLPETILNNQELVAQFHGDWTPEKILEKTGISERHIAAPNECASDLALKASSKLFNSGSCKPQDIDFLLLCTQSPDYFLPTTACILQHQLGIPTSAGALDFNLGCSGFVYGLGLAKGLIESGQARNVLLITAETYSKFINPQDRSVRTLFGDAAAATLIRGAEDGPPGIGPFVYGTDGAGARHLIVPEGGLRHPLSGQPESEDEFGNRRTPANLYMNGPEIFAFTVKVVPELVKEQLKRGGKTLNDFDLFIFHQANLYMVEHLRRKLKIPAEKFLIALRGCGNTVSSTIPIAIKDAVDEGRLRPGSLAMLVGFGVGYSWGSTILRWKD
jgi:3-oxoacyl-[acyl-carrier-protein] synthase III